MSNKKIVIGLVGAMLLSNAVFADDISAFKSGIGAAVRVIKYEARTSHSPIQDGGRYCVSLLTKSRDSVDSDEAAIRLESLGLVALNTKPSYYQVKDSSHLLCLLRAKTMVSAQSRLDSIRNEFPKIDEYYPHIVKMEAYENFKRVVPVVGEIHRDESSTVESLSLRIADLKASVAGCENKRDMMKAAFSKMVSGARHIFAGEAGVYKNGEKSDQKVIIPKKREGFAPKEAETEGSIVYENDNVVIKRGKSAKILRVDPLRHQAEQAKGDKK